MVRYRCPGLKWVKAHDMIHCFLQSEGYFPEVQKVSAEKDITEWVLHRSDVLLNIGLVQREGELLFSIKASKNFQDFSTERSFPQNQEALENLIDEVVDFVEGQADDVKRSVA